MKEISANNMHEIRRRFVQGILKKLPPTELRQFVTGIGEDDEAQARAA